MKADPVLRDWGLVRRNFQGLLQVQVSPEIWRRINELLAGRKGDPEKMLAEYVGAVGGMRTLVGKDEGISEKEFEDQFVVPLLTELGWDMDRTVRRQHEMDIKVGSGRPKRALADFVGFRDAISSKALLVVETKRRIRSDAELQEAVEQCESYSGKLRCGRFMTIAPEGAWVYDLRFPGQSEQLTFIRLNGVSGRRPTNELRPLVGFEPLRDRVR